MFLESIAIGFQALDNRRYTQEGVDTRGYLREIKNFDDVFYRKAKRDIERLGIRSRGRKLTIAVDNSNSNDRRL